MPRLTDIDDIKNSLRNSVEIGLCEGATFPFIEITFSLSETENAKLYDFISEYLKGRPKMQIYFVFKSLRKFARPFNISSYVALMATGVAWIWGMVRVMCVLSEIMEDIPNDGFFDAVGDAEWDVRMVRRFGSRYIELKEI